MSVDFNVYVGPYLDIREPITRGVVDFCASHDRVDAAEFCSKCGRSKTERRRKRNGGPLDDGFWYHDDWVDHLQNVTPANFELHIVDDVRTVRAVSNRRGFGAHVSCDDETVAYDIPTVDGFAEALAPEIARIRELGCSVEIKSGVLVWYS